MSFKGVFPHFIGYFVATHGGNTVEKGQNIGGNVQLHNRGVKVRYQIEKGQNSGENGKI